MNSNRLTHVHVYIIGLVLMLIVGLGMYFGMIRPINEANDGLRTQVQQTESTTVDVYGATLRWDQLNQANAKLAQAKADRTRMQSELDAELGRRSLPPSQAIDLGDKSPNFILANTMNNWVLLPRRVVTTMGRWVERSARRHGVKVDATFSAPAPSMDPTQVASTDIIAWDLGSMSVEGDFNRVMAWARSFNDAPILCSVDNLQCSLAGRNGRVQATATLTVFIFPKMAPGAQAPAGAAAGAGMPGAMGGMSGAMGGGMPGGGGNMAGGGNMGGGVQ